MLDTDQLRSFLAIVDIGSFTRAGRAGQQDPIGGLDAHPPARGAARLRAVRQARPRRAADGGGRELIEYARRIMQAEAGAIAALSRKGLSGAVRLGIPDDYAEAFLADILTRFNHRHPAGGDRRSTCENSLELARAGARRRARPRAGDRPRGSAGFRADPRGAAGLGRRPSAFKSPTSAPIRSRWARPRCLWRQVADDALRDRPGARTGLFFSKNYTAIGPVVRAGLAATVLPMGMIGDGLRVLGAGRGPAELPLTRMGLISRRPGRRPRRRRRSLRRSATPSPRAAARNAGVSDSLSCLVGRGLGARAADRRRSRKPRAPRACAREPAPRRRSAACCLYSGASIRRASSCSGDAAVARSP